MSKADFAIASEGALGQHPLIPFIAGSLELVGIVARDCEEPVVGADMQENTNFEHRAVKSGQEAESIAREVNFASHGLVMITPSKRTVIAKGLYQPDELERIVHCALAYFPFLHLETDMRANQNPACRSAIARFSADLALRLNSRCPRCDFPDGIPHTVAGRPSQWGRGPTNEAWIEKQ